MKRVAIEFGVDAFELQLPDDADVLSMPSVDCLSNPHSELQRALEAPIGCRSLQNMVRDKVAGTHHPAAAIVISDNTRPVPYKGPDGILEPVLEMLRSGGVGEIVVLVATGTHHALDEKALRALLPEAAFAPGIRVVNHDCRDRGSLRCCGRTSRGTEARVDTRYLDADIKMLTGLVEPHFMAGFSGGRKAICPGLVGLEATQVFHGPELMADPRSDSLVLDGNPCHEEALEVARMAGCDFLVNVTIEREKRLTGVFCGDMEKAHAAACAKAAQTNAVPIDNAYDVVITHAGFAGINHYQAAKAACEAAKAVKPGGTLILAARHTDTHPVGSEHYRRVLPMLTELGPERLNERLCAPDWTFQPDQWEVQKWAQALATLGRMENVVYCAPRLTGDLFAECRVPGTDGGVGFRGEDATALAGAMTQHALDACVAANPAASIAVLTDGPYGVPVLRPMDE